MERRTYELKDRQTRAEVARIVANLELGTKIEVKNRTRSDDQNRALHGLIGQIVKQRPTHCNIKVDVETYKRIFMHAIGRECAFAPTLDGTSMFPLGVRTSTLTVSEFSQLVEFILAWCAREGLTIRHFDGQSREAA